MAADSRVVASTVAPASKERKAGPMALASARIVVLHEAADEAERLKSLIEFMDAPDVLASSPAAWQDAIGPGDSGRLAAVFVSRGLGERAISEVCDSVAEVDRNAPIVLCGSGSAEFDVESDYPWARILRLEQPRQFDALSGVLEEVWALQSGHRRGEADAGRGETLIGESADMRMIRALIERVAPSQATVLITGESGTGKELIARQVHAQSGLDGEFVAINCGAIPDNLLESELFGHEKGAFTGAHAARAGRFEQAEGGTLFLDEIGDMPTAMQVKLLRVLQERVIERVGGTRSIPVNLRIVAATHRNLPQRIEEGSFREDLFYRLSVFPIEVTPLRERPEDIAPLIAELIDRLAASFGVRVRLSAAALAALCDYDWPGNVRELANFVERLAVIHPHREVGVDDLPMPLCPAAAGLPASDDIRIPGRAAVAALPADGLDLRKHLASIERSLIAAALRDADGVVQKAAERLGVGRTTLVEKIRRHELRD